MITAINTRTAKATVTVASLATRPGHKYTMIADLKTGEVVHLPGDECTGAIYGHTHCRHTKTARAELQGFLATAAEAVR